MLGIRQRLVALCCAVLLLPGCAQVQAQMDGAERSVQERPAATEALIETVEWGMVNGLFSVLVRNSTDRMLRRADAVVTVRNSAGVVVGSSAATTFQGRCCTAVDLPPGGVFGFYFYAGDTVVDDIDIAYKNVLWSAVGTTGDSQADTTPVSLFRNKSGSVVSADVVAKGGPVDIAIVQAVIDGPDGNFLTVISGSWTCFVPGPPRRIWMQLYTQVPDGSTIRMVTAFPRSGDLAAGGDANLQTTCDPKTDAAGGSEPPSPPPTE